MRKAILLCLASVMTACASTHSGYVARDEKGKVAVKGGLTVSVLENTALSTKNFLALDFVFENTTADWVTVQMTNLSFLSTAADEHMKIVTGMELGAWSEASQRKAAMDAYNTSLVLSALTVAGSVAATTGRASGTDAGAAVALGAGTALTVQQLSAKKSALEKSKVIPPTHLAAGDFAVPPGLSVSRWIVFYAKDGNAFPFLRELTLSVKVNPGKVEDFKMPFRRVTGSEFQTRHPDNQHNR